jgi:SET domain-containing protein 6
VEANKDRGSETGGSDADEAEDPHPNISIESSMHIDNAHPQPSFLEDTNEGLESDSEDDEEDDTSDIAMVPMADLLNARWGSENVSSVLLRFTCILFVFFIRLPCRASFGRFRCGLICQLTPINGVQAKLFYEPSVLRMVTTKGIKQGEQVVSVLPPHLTISVVIYVYSLLPRCHW